jgi:hypothetical protein
VTKIISVATVNLVTPEAAGKKPLGRKGRKGWPETNKHYSLLGPFISYEENEVF